MRASTILAPSRGALAALSLILPALVGCSHGPPAPIADNRAVAYVDPDGSHELASIDTLRNRFPHLKFADGQISLNDRCPVRQVPLNIRLPGLYVNGKPIGFC